MPMVPTSPSACTYSWLFAYLLSSGVIKTLLFRSLVKRRGNDAGARLFAADQNSELTALGRFVERKICETDRLFQCRRMRAAGDDADLFASVHHRVAVTGD